jgi:hypothetical protein
MDFNCKSCNKKYGSYQSLWNHNKKFHNNQNINDHQYNCKNCNKKLSSRQSRWRHLKICRKVTDDGKSKSYNKVKLKNDDTFNLKKENEELKKELSNINNVPINNQLINIISDKNKKIEELSKNIQLNNQTIIEKQIKTFESLTLNNIVITSRSDDNFINATQLCQAGGKRFHNWYQLDTTKQLINEAASEAGIPASLLVDIKKGNSTEFNQGTWIHPELAIQLAQWLSPKFAIQVSKWIINLFTNGKVEINTKLVTENKLKDQRIKLLEDTYVKKHKREDFPDKNVIYIITTVDHLKNRIYIVGKAKNLKNRLSTYNKTCDHQVIYYKKCVDEETLNLVELNVLKKLKKYQEKANRDRFILPLENDITLFTNIIEICINFFE